MLPVIRPSASATRPRSQSGHLHRRPGCHHKAATRSPGSANNGLGFKRFMRGSSVCVLFSRNDDLSSHDDCEHFLAKHAVAAVRSVVPSLYCCSTYDTSVASQRKCTLSHPTASISSAVAHMQMHQLSPRFARISLSHRASSWPVICQKSPCAPHDLGCPADPSS